MTETKSGASFRDPSGFVFVRDGILYRQINRRYQETFEALHESGLYEKLISNGLLVEHETVEEPPFDPDDGVAVIRPQVVPFISYPYEWCFDQLKEAALATLRIQLLALKKGMTLKDATAFNIQFLNGKAIHIDTLSFDVYKDGQPWMAYNQFCKHFLAPLVLMAIHDLRLGRLTAQFLDGIPLDIASKLLPWKTRLNPLLLVHIHAHGKMATKDASTSGTPGKVRKEGLVLMLQSLKSYIEKLRPKGESAWARYYSECTYTDADLVSKAKLIDQFVDAIPDEIPTACDLGANTGHFSKLLTARGIRTVAMDADPWAVNQCFRNAQETMDELLLPLVQDLTNMSPGAGVRNDERDSMLARAKCDLLMVLALVHHLTIGFNVPFPLVAALFAEIGKYAIVEFVPADDPQSKRLMRFREDVFDGYTQASFEAAFKSHFEILRSEPVGSIGRTLYLMRRLGT